MATWSISVNIIIIGAESKDSARLLKLGSGRLSTQTKLAIASPAGGRDKPGTGRRHNLNAGTARANRDRRDRGGANCRTRGARSGVALDLVRRLFRNRTAYARGWYEHDSSP